MKIGFIGLGIMGKPMARNLIKAGYKLVVYNRTKEKEKELIDLGAESVHSPKEIAEKALTIAGDICVFTNHSQTVDVLDY